MAEPIARNQKAYHAYHILEKIEAGLILTGSEVKSLRAHRASLADAYARARKGEIFLLKMHIPPYEPAALANHEPTRPRKLLLHRRQIDALAAKTERKGLTLVPLSVYFRNGFAKVELGLAKGKNRFDKRQSIKKREEERAVRRAIGRRE